MDMERRHALFALCAAGPAVAALLASCGNPEDRRPGMGGRSPGMGRMPDWMMGPDQMGPQMMQDMPVIHGLLVAHADIDRQVTDIAGGIRADTTGDSPETARLIREHVRRMKARIEAGDPIRDMDPLFREIFEHHQAISLRVEDVPGGVRAVETSRDPQVTLLIRQHAHRAVSEFVESGMQRAMQPTPLPAGYRS